VVCGEKGEVLISNSKNGGGEFVWVMRPCFRGQRQR